MRRIDGQFLFVLGLCFCLLGFCGELYGKVAPAVQPLVSGWKLARSPEVAQTGAQISLATFNDEKWISACVPGTALASYEKTGLIPDCYFGLNMANLSQDYYNTNYWFRNTFEIPLSYSGQRIWLNFDGINWKADVFVNGSFIGHIDGPFIRGQFDVTSKVVCGGSNSLAVLIYWSNAEVPDSPTFIASASWDFMPAIPGRNVGIYEPVFLSTSGDVKIVDPFVLTDLPLPKTSPANLTVRAELTNQSASAVNGDLIGLIKPEGISFTQNVTVAAESSATVVLSPKTLPQLSLSNPALWWPNGYGPQNLHTLQLSFQSGANVSDQKNVTFGIRKFTYNANGHELELSVNGQKILCKGGNWGMPDAMLKFSSQQIDTAVRLHKEMNFNMIRAWHGTSDLQPFYDACDQYGILVWDEFWLNGTDFGLAPREPKMFVANAQDKIKRLRNHASIAVWCGQNEAIPPAALNAALGLAFTNLDNTRIYIPASNQGPIHGGGPYALQEPSWYFANAHGFTTEIGLPSISPIESLRAMIPAENLWPIGATNWMYHDWNAGIGNKGLDQYIDAVSARYGKASGIEDFSRKAQLLNLESYKAIFEAWNKRMFDDCSGVLLWMSQPAWRSTIWQTYDWDFELGGAFFGSKKGAEPVHIQWCCDDGSVKIVNATPRALSGLTAQIQVFNADGSLKFETNSTGIRVEANSLAQCGGVFEGNLALHRPIYVSSVEKGMNVATNAADGNQGSRWSSLYSDPQWLYVDLGSTQLIDTTAIFWESYAKAYQIQVALDTNAWTTVWSTNDMTLGTHPGYVVSTFAPIKARYVRMLGTQRATMWGYSIFELQVFKAGSFNNGIPNLSDVHFIKLNLKDGKGNLLSDNFYWRGIRGSDYSSLNTLPLVEVQGRSTSRTAGATTKITTKLTAPTCGVAFGIRLKLVKQTSGQRVLPAIYSDNYFSLLPNESKVVTIDCAAADLAGDRPRVILQGWNVISNAWNIEEEAAH